MMISRVHNLDYYSLAGRVSKVDLLILDPFFHEWEKFYDVPFDCLKDDAVVVAFSNRPHTGRLQVALDQQLHFITEVVWNFADGRWVSNKLPRICHENILIYSMSHKRKLNDMRLLEWIEKPKPTKKGGASIGKWTTENRYYSPKDKAQVESVIYLPRNVGKIMGIVSKPVRLIELLLLMATSSDSLVFDPFCGSGTTAIACINLGRRYVLGDKDIEACQVADNRIEDAMRYKQLVLYGEDAERID